VRGPGALRRVWIEGPGIASLEGIERMSQLEQLKLTRVAPSLSLAPLGGVASTLRTLVIVEMRGDFDGSPIAQLSGLRHLLFQAHDDAAADAFARVDLSPLARLEILTAGTEGARRPLDLQAIANMPALRQLALHGFFVQDHDVPTVCAAPALRCSASEPRVRRSSASSGSVWANTSTWATTSRTRWAHSARSTSMPASSPTETARRRRSR
jgi:hypothetical protein